MLKNLNDFSGYSVMSTDGVDLGKIDDGYFDKEWKIRYLIVKGGGWFKRHFITLSPASVGRLDTGKGQINVSLESHQLSDAPHFEIDAATRRKEAEYSNHFQLPSYWKEKDAIKAAAAPSERSDRASEGAFAQADEATLDNIHLHSIKAIRGGHVDAIDGEIGHVEGFLVDDSTWAIRFLIVDTSNWLGGRTVLVPPLHVTNLDVRQNLHVNLHRSVIQNSPEYDPTTDLSAVYEHRLEQAYELPVQQF